MYDKYFYMKIFYIFFFKNVFNINTYILLNDIFLYVNILGIDFQGL